MVSCRLTVLLIKLSIIQVFGFNDPKEESTTSEVFQFQNHDYVFSTNQITWQEAWLVCRQQQFGALLTLEKDEKYGECDFVISAMSESNLIFDALWIGLRKRNDSFVWENTSVILPDKDFTCSQHDHIKYEDHDCGVIVRKNHLAACFAKLSCAAKRGYICKKEINDTSTHPNWIPMGDRLYKIYSTRMCYYDAAIACRKHDKQATLATLLSRENASTLGRFLTIGRPSLENAWIGARWFNNTGYRFEYESFNNTAWWPWLNEQLIEPEGCIVLDRHLTNMTTFVPTNCIRLRSYICYKLLPTASVGVCISATHNYRIYYSPKSWHSALRTCQKLETGTLPVIKSDDDLYYLVLVMESYSQALSHAWLGAEYIENKWKWLSSTGPTIKVLPWLENKTFDEEIERHNRCLNIDRENTLGTILYGTVCDFPQPFICQYGDVNVCNNHSGEFEQLKELTVTPSVTPVDKTDATK